MIRRAVWLLALGLLAGLPAEVAAEPVRVEVTSPAEVRGLRLADADGDGIDDLLLIGGRTVAVFRGRQGQLPAAKPDWQVEAPRDVSFVDVALPKSSALPGLMSFGQRGAMRLPFKAGAPPHRVTGGDALSWQDQTKLTFTDLTQPGGALLFPRAVGWTYRQPGAKGDIQLDVAPYRSVRAPGPFLEDTCTSVWGLPAVVLGRAAWRDAKAEDACLWTIDGRAVIAQATQGRVRYDLSFLDRNAADGRVEQRLIDLDRDGRPELMHRVHANLETRYGFFRTKPAEPGATTGPTHRPAASALYLPGYQFPPDLVDVNGDGYLDLVVTGIQVNPANTLLAMTTGKVTAETLAFLNQGQGATSWFRKEPDAVVKSKIGVNVRFNYRGTIEVERFFTIVADADVNGDGRTDLVIRTSDTELTIWDGVKDGAWAKDGRTVAIPPRGASPDIEGYAADLDGDKRDELVLLYRQPPQGADRVWIVDAE